MAGNPFRYDGKRVVVTGGSSGVGAALVALLEELGAERVSVLDRKPPAGRVAYLETDLGDPASVDAAAAAIDGRVDVLFNNAGVSARQPTPVVMAVNLLGLRRLSERLLPRVPRGGAIVNTASLAGNQWPLRAAAIDELLAIGDWDAALAWVAGHPEVVADPYAFSKECVQRHTLRASRATIARGVRTNSVCPGPIDTPLMAEFRATISDRVIDWSVSQQGIPRMMQGADVAPALAFLGSDAAAFVNGVNLPVDAGFSAALATGQVDFGGLAASGARPAEGGS
jgi:NAD(P)-dependent dehydrogenase (short-subunit alcohol dehydrogenase family)